MQSRIGIRLCLAAALAWGTASAGHAQSGRIAGEPALAYWEAGAGEPLLVVLHGGPGLSHDYLRPEWDGLAGYARVIFYDQRGCTGRSGAGSSYTWRDHMGDLKRLLSEFAPDRRVVLAGSSWGSLLALLYAMEHPDDVSALVLSGLPAWQGPHDAEHRAVAAPAVRPDTVHGAVLAPARLDSLRAALLRRLPEICVRFAPRPDRTEGHMHLEHPPLSRLAGIAAPVLLVRGGQAGANVTDGTGTAAALLPRAALVTIPEADLHDPWATHPERFHDMVRGFLSQAVAPPRR